MDEAHLLDAIEVIRAAWKLPPRPWRVVLPTAMGQHLRAHISQRTGIPAEQVTKEQMLHEVQQAAWRVGIPVPEGIEWGGQHWARPPHEWAAQLRERFKATPGEPKGLAGMDHALHSSHATSRWMR